MRNIFLTFIVLFMVACSGAPAPQCPTLPVMTDAGTTVDMSAYEKEAIKVTVQEGSANFHDINGFAPYQPVTLTLKPGEKQTVQLKKFGDDFFDSQVPLSFSYLSGVLWIDGQTIEDAALFSINPVWIKGQTYAAINTHGNAALRQANVIVMLQNS